MNGEGERAAGRRSVAAFSVLNVALAGLAVLESLDVTLPGSIAVTVGATACWLLGRGSRTSAVLMSCLAALAVGLHINALRGFPESHFAVSSR